MTLFLDTNVLVDFCAVRQPFFHEASIIIDLAVKKQIDIVASSLSFINIAYVLRKQYPKENVMNQIEQLIKVCDISIIDSYIIKSAVAMRANDFEDSVQYLSSRMANANIIITRDKTGFNEFNIPVQTPAEFVQACMSQ